MASLVVGKFGAKEPFSLKGQFREIDDGFIGKLTDLTAGIALSPTSTCI
jgi:hypothetical protein